MKGKMYFQKCCQDAEVDCGMFFKLGAQTAKYSGGYVYHCPYKLRAPSQTHIVNYLKERDIYVAWALDYPEAKRKVVFRVLENALSPLNRGEVLEISKSLGHRGWGEETVYAFDREAVPQFIQRVTGEEQSVSCG